MEGAETELTVSTITGDNTNIYPTSMDFSFLPTATLNTTVGNIGSTHVEYSPLSSFQSNTFNSMIKFYATY